MASFDLVELAGAVADEPAREFPPVEADALHARADPERAAHLAQPRRQQASALSCYVPAVKAGTRVALPTVRGSAVCRPATSLNTTRRSASTSTAVNADKLSLSPSLISSTTTVSFSFTTGTTRHSSSAIIAC